ncbi:MAG: hypothetical protein LBD37_02855 [Treponema sp.]|jgi:hypothetical protein|nr:hypothetical protein [Treponema sp.]
MKKRIPLPPPILARSNLFSDSLRGGIIPGGEATGITAFMLAGSAKIVTIPLYSARSSGAVSLSRLFRASDLIRPINSYFS